MGSSEKDTVLSFPAVQKGITASVLSFHSDRYWLTLHSFVEQIQIREKKIRENEGKRCILLVGKGLLLGKKIVFLEADIVEMI